MKYLLEEADELLLNEEQLVNEFKFNFKKLIDQGKDFIGSVFHRSNKTLRPWGLYEISYKFHKNDATPLIMPFENKGGRWFGINFHYMHPEVRIAVVEKLMLADKLKHRSADIDWTDIDKMFSDLSFCFRSYKNEGIGQIKGISYYDFLGKYLASKGQMTDSHMIDMYKKSQEALR